VTDGLGGTANGEASAWSSPFLAVVLLAAACASSAPPGLSERRAYAELTKATTLAELDRARPDVRAQMSRAAGWAVFADGGAPALGMKDGVGFGVAHDNKTGAETYLRMRRPEGGRPCRLVLVFADVKPFAQFVAVGGRFDGAPPEGVEVYQFLGPDPVVPPETAGTSFSLDPDLNRGR
jgi:hypothetical protein